MAISAPAVAYTVTGGLILYSGIKGATIAATVQSALQGNLTPADTETIDFSSGSGGDGSGSGGSGAVPSGSAAKAQAYAKSKMASYGWSSQDYSDLVSLWTRESGWSNTADNPTSGAYGIPQALPYSKMPKAAWPSSAGGSSDAESQIDWGLSYIKQRYGSPSMAWGHEEQNGWY